MKNILLEGGAFDTQSMIMLGAAVLVVYFFILRPGMQRQKKEKQFQEDITKGTHVIMTSGIHGRISEVNENNNTVVVDTGAGKIRFQRAAISMDMTTSWNTKDKKESDKK